MKPRAMVLLLVLLAGATVYAADAPSELIFSPKDPIPRKNGKVGALDFMQLFVPSAPWAEAAHHVAVFKLYPQFVSGASDEDLRTVIQDLKRRGIALGLEAGALIPTSDYGRGVEGFGGEKGPVWAQRIKELGGSLSYLDVDEPYTFGCRYTGPHAAHLPMKQAALEVMEFIKNMKSIFPDISIGDAECLGAGSGSLVTVQDLSSWLEAYRQANGAPFPFFLVDVEWARPGAFAEVRELQTWVQSHGMKYGIIYDGDAADGSDAEWLGHAEQAYSLYELMGERCPDQVVMQSWHDHPKHLLPESDPDCYAHQINSYYRPSTRMEVAVRFNPQDHRCRTSGRLTSDHGVPIPAAVINLSMEALDEIDGEVPQGASGATVGLHVDPAKSTSGQCDVLVSGMCFESGTGNLVPNGELRNGLKGWGVGEHGVVQREAIPGRGIHVRAGTADSAEVNSPMFAVTAGNHYRFTVAAHEAITTAGRGYFDLTFMRADGQELQRQKLPFVASCSLGAATTAADGTFSSQSSASPGSWKIVARFAGDERWRPSETAYSPDR
jgi:hypothetical protein